MTLTWIKWWDAVSEEASEPATTAKAGLVQLEEVGFLLNETDEAVLIGMELHSDSEITPGRWRLHIPKGAIADRRDVSIEEAFLSRRRRRSSKKS